MLPLVKLFRVQNEKKNDRGTSKIFFFENNKDNYYAGLCGFMMLFGHLELGIL